MTNLIWTLDEEGRLTATWNTPPSAHSFSTRWHTAQTECSVVHALLQAGAVPGRFSRAVALAAYFRIQAAYARHQGYRI